MSAGREVTAITPASKAKPDGPELRRTPSHVGRRGWRRPNPLADREEAASFAANPGFAIGYLIGKLQIHKLLADASRQQGETFRLREVQDCVWRDGNVPLSLQRFELLGDRSELARLTE